MRVARPVAARPVASGKGAAKAAVKKEVKKEPQKTEPQKHPARRRVSQKSSIVKPIAHNPPITTESLRVLAKSERNPYLAVEPKKCGCCNQDTHQYDADVVAAGMNWFLYWGKCVTHRDGMIHPSGKWCSSCKEVNTLHFPR